jgi:hypothetical protein
MRREVGKYSAQSGVLKPGSVAFAKEPLHSFSLSSGTLVYTFPNDSKDPYFFAGFPPKPEMRS